MKWEVIDSWEGGWTSQTTTRAPAGLKSSEVHEYEKDVAIAELFLHLTFADSCVIFGKLNEAVAVHNNNSTNRKGEAIHGHRVSYRLGLADWGS